MMKNTTKTAAVAAGTMLFNDWLERLAALSLRICEVSRRGRHSQRNGVRTPVRSEGQPLPPFE